MVDVSLVSRLILSEAYANATKEQIIAFEERKKTLLDTYVTTLLEFEDYILRQMKRLRSIKEHMKFQ